MQLYVIIHQTGVVCTLQFLTGGNTVHKTVGNTAVAFATVCPLPSLPPWNATLQQVLEACAYPLPTFPYTHADATA